MRTGFRPRAEMRRSRDGRNVPAVSNAGWTLAIDFGTTASAAAVVNGDGAKRSGSATPANGCFPACSSRTPGFCSPEPPHTTAPGRIRHGPSGPRSATWAAMTPSPSPAATSLSPDLVAAVLSAAVARASEAAGGNPPERVVLTHPARWGRPHSPCSAQQRPGRHRRRPPPVDPRTRGRGIRHRPPRLRRFDHAVYDLGGGTFDVAVLRRVDGAGPSPGEPEGSTRWAEPPSIRCSAPISSNRSPRAPPTTPADHHATRWRDAARDDGPRTWSGRRCSSPRRRRRRCTSHRSKRSSCSSPATSSRSSFARRSKPPSPNCSAPSPRPVSIPPPSPVCSCAATRPVCPSSPAPSPNASRGSTSLLRGPQGCRRPRRRSPADPAPRPGPRPARPPRAASLPDSLPGTATRTGPGGSGSGPLGGT